MNNMIAKLKRRYADLRFGYAQIGVIIGLANFLLIAYNFTNAKDIVSFPIFVGFTALGFAVVLVLIGHAFKRTQMSTDHDIGFEYAPMNAKTFRLILEQLPLTEESISFIKYLKQIETQTL